MKAMLADRDQDLPWFPRKMPTATANAVFVVSAGILSMMILTHFKENRDEPKLLSKSERPRRFLFGGSGWRHNDRVGVLDSRGGGKCFLYITLRGIDVASLLSGALADCT